MKVLIHHPDNPSSRSFHLSLQKNQWTKVDVRVLDETVRVQNKSPDLFESFRRGLSGVEAELPEEIAEQIFSFKDLQDLVESERHQQHPRPIASWAVDFLTRNVFHKNRAGSKLGFSLLALILVELFYIPWRILSSPIRYLLSPGFRAFLRHKSWKKEREWRLARTLTDWRQSVTAT